MALKFSATGAAATKESAAKTGNQVPKATYEKIMCEAEAKYGIEEGTICNPAMLTGLKTSRKIIVAGKGSISPLIAIEVHFLDIILELASMHQQLTPCRETSLINSLVETSDLHRDIVQ